ncbi:hypothetical protein FQR65_LT10319 [Abscondita terminalis]|nr:hypothetical protein FQR65_LT10319 [Abscondita terminalis]
MISIQWVVFFGLFLAPIVQSRIHRLFIKNDTRKYIPITKFGFYQGGRLNIQLEKFQSFPHNEHAVFGFSLECTTSMSTRNRYIDNDPEFCITIDSNGNGDVVYFVMDLARHEMKVVYSFNWNGSRQLQSSMDTSYNVNFSMNVTSSAEEGLYRLYFHNCLHQQEAVNFQIQIIEMNSWSYLSVEEMPLSFLYIISFVLYILSGTAWILLLRRSKHSVFELHYLMTAVIFVKALSLAFQAINYHMIGRLGRTITTWLLSYYVTYIANDVLLLITLVLIGTGWSFIKHVLLLHDKLIFCAIIPLQILGKVSFVIFNESELSTLSHETWGTVFRVMDFLCCCCILLPVFCSLRHLRQAKGVYGEHYLFRNFYIMIVIYIYFTRIVPFLLHTIVSFQYGWLEQALQEIITYIFLLWTGFKFRPAVHHQYYAYLKDKYQENKL